MALNDDLQEVWRYIQETYRESYGLYLIQLDRLEEELESPDNVIEGEPTVLEYQAYFGGKLKRDVIPCKEEIERQRLVFGRMRGLRDTLFKSIYMEHRTDQHIKDALERISVKQGVKLWD